MNGSAFTPDKDLAKVLKILRALEPTEVEALNRFYTQGQDTARVAMDLGIAIGRFRELKSRVKQAYLTMERPN